MGTQRVPLGLKCIVLNTYLHECQGFYSQKAQTWKALLTRLLYSSQWASGLPESQWTICIHKLIAYLYLLCLVLAMDFAVWTQHSLRMLKTLMEPMQAHCLSRGNSVGRDVLHWESGEERKPVLNSPFHFLCTWIHKCMWHFLSKCFKDVMFISSTYTALAIC